jgi:Ribonuclease G/E
VSQRRLYLDPGFGETRGVLTLGDRAHRLLIERAGDLPSQQWGSRSVARVSRIERGLGFAFLQMPDGPDGLLPLSAAVASLTEGALVEVEVTAEARNDKLGGSKGVTLRLIDASAPPIRLLAAAPPLDERLQALAPGIAIVAGQEAREACDIAQDEALATSHPLPGGGSISVEPTRALVAIDVDVGARSGGDARRIARQTNLAAIAEAARLLRLKGLGGLVVIDLVGKGHDGVTFANAARTAFAEEGADVAIGPISRFGLFELSIPHGTAPVAEQLLDGSGTVSALTTAFAMLRAMDREARAQPGGRIIAYCAADVAEAAAGPLAVLTARVGPLFYVEAKDGLGRRFEVVAQ